MDVTSPHYSCGMIRTLAIALALMVVVPCSAQHTGQLGAHDPSTLIKSGTQYYYFATGNGIASRNSSNLAAWSGGPAVFGSPPAWTTQAVPNFTGHFWAPDIAYFNGKYHLYYSVSDWGTIDSAIGVVTTPSLSSPTWTDLGKVVQSDAVWEAGPNTDTTGYNAIDPSILVDTDGKVWMAFGSYSSGILVTEIEPTTGKRKNTSTLAATQVANNASGGGWGSTIEGAALTKHGNFYYLFLNYGGCCSGVDSTYDIRVGRSASPTGPFLDQSGVDMRSSGGTIFLDDDGRRMGPGHFSMMTDAGQDYFGYHYYNGDANGAPTYNLRTLHWTTDDWPSAADINPTWSGNSDSNWTTAANWSSDGVPNSVGAVANFVSNRFGRFSVAIDGGNKTVGTVNFRGSSSFVIGTNPGNTLNLDAAAGEWATLNVAQGQHTLASPLTAVDSLGINVSTSSTLTVSGAVSAPALTKYGHGKFIISGSNAYSGSVFVRRGEFEVSGSVSSGQFSGVGIIAGDNATMTVRGTGQFSANADLNIGDTGDSATPATGVLNLQDNASITVGTGGAFVVGSGFFSNTRAMGTVNQSGGTLTANGTADGGFVVGGRGSALAQGTYNLSAGQVITNTNSWVGGRGTGTMNQTGGTFTANNYLAIGRHAGGTGVWNISDGELDVTHPSRWLLVGESGTGTLNIANTGQVSTTNAMRVGHSGGAGTVNLDGGTLTTLAVQRGTGTATFNFNGGTLIPATSSTAFFQGLTTARVKAGGAVIDTASMHITVAQVLMHDTSLGSIADGGLHKLGLGTLTLTGTNTYTGDTIVDAGTLSILQPYLANSADVFVSAGASFDLNFIGTDIINSLFIDGLSKSIGTHGAIGSGADFEWSIFSGTGLLQVTTFAGIVGDFDNDGDVDGRDFLVWQRNPSVGDLADWQSNYGVGTLSSINAVPEPKSALLLLAVAILLPASRFSRR
jgi:autotransporter-associated beta strand protein/T5SS/PEP-CTERM-associated repeat protein